MDTEAETAPSLQNDGARKTTIFVQSAIPATAALKRRLWKGEQYVAIGAGGHSESGATIGDSMVAFRLARPGEAPSLWSRTIDRPGGRFLSKAIGFGLAIVLTIVAVWRWRRRARLRRISASSI